MIENFNENDALKFKNIPQKEKDKKGILGRLYGPIADCIHSTRNGRKYSEELWENVFNSEIVKEKFENGGIMGELCHPDYDEVDMEKVAVIMPEPPKKDKNGKLVAYIDILDTPCGRIAYQLAKYGYKFGISSRGNGDLIEDYNSGEEMVDPETYSLNAFDLVEIPAVKEARLSFTESYDKKSGKTLYEALDCERGKCKDEKELEVFDEKLQELNESSTGMPNWMVDVAKKIVGPKRVQEINDQVDAMFEGLQNSFEPEDEGKEQLREENEEPTFEEKVDALHDNMLELKDEADDRPNLQQFLGSVSDILDSYNFSDDASWEYELFNKSVDNAEPELLDEFNEALKQVKLLKHRNKDLQEQLSVCNAKVDESKDLSVKLDKLQEANKTNANRANSLIEKLNEKTKLVDTLTEEVQYKTRLLNETSDSLANERSYYDGIQEKLDLVTKQLTESKELLNKYRKSYSALKESYIATKAELYGVDKQVLTKKLDESKKLSSIDRICESLRQDKLNLEKLPFDLNSTTSVSISAPKDSMESYLPDDDCISDSLIRMANF